MPRPYNLVTPPRSYSPNPRRIGAGPPFALLPPVADLRAVLLDVDGTLVDSNDAHARAWVDAFDHFGHGVTFEQVKALIGKGGDKILRELAGIDVESEQGKEIEELRGQLFMREYLPQLRPFPKARDLLLRLREDGLYLVIATSAKQAEMDALLDVCGAHGIVDACTSSDDAERSKPDPDIIYAAMAKAEALASECLMLGDTPYDVESARRAYVPTVALRTGGWPDSELAHAVAVYDDVADVLAHYARSPFVERQGYRLISA